MTYMKSISKYITAAALLLSAAIPAVAQDNGGDGIVRRRSGSERSRDKNAAADNSPIVTGRMQAFYENDGLSASDA